MRSSFSTAGEQGQYLIDSNKLAVSQRRDTLHIRFERRLHAEYWPLAAFDEAECKGLFRATFLALLKKLGSSEDLDPLVLDLKVTGSSSELCVAFCCLCSQLKQ